MFTMFTITVKCVSMLSFANQQHKNKVQMKFIGISLVLVRNCLNILGNMLINFLAEELDHVTLHLSIITSNRVGKNNLAISLALLKDWK